MVNHIDRGEVGQAVFFPGHRSGHRNHVIGMRMDGRAGYCHKEIITEGRDNYKKKKSKENTSSANS
jgi:hypothetical protein